jgi:2-dehydropantoate 2-reductase
MNRLNTRILVYGAGVEGSLYAAKLHEAGYDVSILARGQRLIDLREYGVVLEDALSGQQTTTRLEVVDQLKPGDTYDWVIVPMRKNQVAAILPILAANQHTPNVLFMTNNAAGPDEFVKALGRERVLLGFPGTGGERKGHIIRCVTQAGRSKIRTTIGEVDGCVTPRLREIANLLESAGFQAIINRNMDAWLKTHVAIVSPIANALYMAGGDNYRLARTRDAVVLGIRAMREGFQVLRALGIPIEPPALRIYERTPEPILVWLVQRLFATQLAELMLARHANAARDEMQQLADEFRALARQTSVPTPAMDQLYTHIDPTVPTAMEGRAQLPMEWRGVWIGLGALTASGVIGWWAKRLKHKGLLLPVAAGMLGVFMIRRRKTDGPRLPDARIWQQTSIAQRGATESEALIAKVQERYEELYRSRPRYDHPALRMHLEANILPGLALYQVLLAEKGDQAAALAEVESLFHASAVQSKLRKATENLKYLPEPFMLFRLIMRPIMQYGFPSSGWETEFVEASRQRIAFNIHRCFYLNTFTSYGAPELTRLFCQMDDVVYEALPASIRWERTGTLGRGDAVCDFCFRRVA